MVESGLEPRRRRIGAGTARARDTDARLPAGGLNEVEHDHLSLRVEAILCLHEPDAALGAKRLRGSILSWRVELARRRTAFVCGV
jgi:hypothetical protein